jgi:tRNA-Thr(GGU) m(6)t(6)A37 methyltransferase TsaA
MDDPRYTLQIVGRVSSPLTSREQCPKQGREGAPEAWLEIEPAFADAVEGIHAGDDILVLTWLHLGLRDVLRVRPRGEASRPLRGVFSTRSPDRPNPIGLHRVEVLEVRGNRLHVRPLEALDGTPILDIKPVLPRVDE